jgi:Succinyl-CoA synthetase, alpha subunit
MREEKPSLKIRVRYPYYTVNVKKGYYMDSIQLLKISEEVKKVPGVLEALIAMGTDTNKELLKMLGFSYEDLNVTPNDLIIAIGAESEDALKNAVNTAERLLEEGVGETREYYADLDTALSKNPDISIALISIPGQYVKDVAMKLIDRGINLHIFSDNVPVNDEIEIKKRALEKNVLVLGPGAGTVIIKGVGLGFANKVNVGSVGIVAASGTGLQEVSSLLSEIGIGISYGLGVGGNDVKNAIGGIMTIKALEFLQNDDDTKF